MGSNLAEKRDILETCQQTLNLEKRRLGRSGIMVSPIGFGSLRLTPEDGIYRETLYKALQSGIHFVDTSGTYGNGASEIVIGEVIREYLSEEPEQKDSIVLCTKMGLVQGSTLQEIKKQKKINQEGCYRISEKLSYCLTPEFMESQISLSIRRLQTDKVHLVLLQSPEYLIKLLHTKKAFKQYLKRAFEHLEVEVTRGRIDHYGISSSAFLNKDISKNFLNLGEIFDLARSISEDHHFSVVQVPFNLFETSALFIQNQERLTFFEAAGKHDLGILSCRPLTSRHRNKVYHFITFSGKDEVSIKGHLHKTLVDVIGLEKILFKKRPQHKNLNWGHQLKKNLNEISDWWQWKNYMKRHILPSIEKGIEGLPENQEWNHWKIHYVNHTHNLFTLITDSLQGIANLRTNQISHYLDEQCPSLVGDPKLSNKVTRLYLSLPQISSIVIGLSHPKHMDDLLGLGPAPKESRARQILGKIGMYF